MTADYSGRAALAARSQDRPQLLSGSVASYVLGQLALGKQPADVAIPGLTGVVYLRAPSSSQDGR